MELISEGLDLAHLKKNGTPILLSQTHTKTVMKVMTPARITNFHISEFTSRVPLAVLKKLVLKMVARNVLGRYTIVRPAIVFIEVLSRRVSTAMIFDSSAVR